MSCGRFSDEETVVQRAALNHFLEVTERVVGGEDVGNQIFPIQLWLRPPHP